MLPSILVFLLFIGIAFSLYYWSLCVGPEKLSTFSNLLVATATFLAVLTALFREKILSVFYRPQLVVQLADGEKGYASVLINPRPDWGKSVSGEPDVVFDKVHISVGINIINTGNCAAQNVSVFFNGIKSSYLTQFNRYKSIPLRRSWVGTSSIELLPPKLPFRFDIGYISNDEPDSFHFLFAATPIELSKIKFSKYPQEFEFEIITSCNQGVITCQKLKIHFGDLYNKDFSVSLI